MASKNANGRVRKKAQLPHKLCLRCQLPMVWRKAWAKNWESVRYCSERCRRG